MGEKLRGAGLERGEVGRRQDFREERVAKEKVAGEVGRDDLDPAQGLVGRKIFDDVRAQPLPHGQKIHGECRLLPLREAPGLSEEELDKHAPRRRAVFPHQELMKSGKYCCFRFLIS